MRMSFSVQIPNAGRQQKDLAFHRCGNSCKRMATEVRTRAAARWNVTKLGLTTKSIVEGWSNQCMGSEPKEIELKLQIAPKDIAVLKNHPSFAGSL